MIRRILLINPNFHYFPGWLENIVNYKRIPFGITYLASYIREKYPVEVKICDASLLNISESEVLNYINIFKPDIIGITATTPAIKFARNVAFQARSLLPGTYIIFGGPHITALPFENLDIADVCVIGEGEETFGELVNNFLKGISLDEIKGIAFRKNNKNIKTENRELIKNLDSLPFPARDLFPKSNYRHIFPYKLKNPYYSSILTSRGCNFSCNFCLNELMWKKDIRYRSLDNVFEEMEGLVKKYETSLLFITDDNFTANTNRLMEFCKIKKKYFPKLQWICHSRADSLRLELLNEMKAADCVEIQIGVESGDDNILYNCNKNIKTLAIRNTFKLLKKTKINQWATFIIGNEGETKASIERTIRFSREIDPTYATFMFLNPLPGTKVFENFSKNGYIKTFDWGKYNWHSEPIFETEHLSKELLMELRKKAYRKFYLRPKIILRYLYAYIISRQFKLMFSEFLLLVKFILGLIKK